MEPVLEAVPNFSEGRDLGVVRELVRAIENEGAEVLDWSADADHHRAVITVAGSPRVVEEASVSAAKVAVNSIDMREHEGVHPRIGALDVLPFVPLVNLDMTDAVDSARRVARRLAEEAGLPTFLYGEASEPSGRGLADLRRGGFEGLRDGFPDGIQPDFRPPAWPYAGGHPTAGASCVGARHLLLAWNVYVEGLDVAQAQRIASGVRESGGGFCGLRALGLELTRSGRIQISMNLEDLDRTSPFDVFRALEDGVAAEGGRIVATEVIGMIPDALVLPAAVDRLQLVDSGNSRLLSRGLVRHLAERGARTLHRPTEQLTGVRSQDDDR